MDINSRERTQGGKAEAKSPSSSQNLTPRRKDAKTDFELQDGRKFGADLSDDLSDEALLDD
jgi:hypothetical protein